MPSPTPAPPTSWKTTAVCGGLSVPVIMPALPHGMPVLNVSVATFKGWFTPRLSV